jgi:hypothetical protein
MCWKCGWAYLKILMKLGDIIYYRCLKCECHWGHSEVTGAIYENYNDMLTGA